MADANLPQNPDATLAAVPREILDLILQEVFRGARIRIHRDPSRPDRHIIVRRLAVDGDANRHSRYPPHPLSYVNRVLAGEVRLFARRAEFNTLAVSNVDRLFYFPLHLFDRITNLSLTMPQATNMLHAAIPRIRPGYNSIQPPQRALRLVSAPNVVRLEIRWTLPNPFANPQLVLNPTLDAARTAITRLLFFRRDFQVIVHFSAVDNGRLIMTGTLIDSVLRPSWPAPWDGAAWASTRGTFEQSLRRLVWLPSDTNYWHVVEYRHILTNAHPHRDFVSLSWIDPLPNGRGRALPAYFPPRRATPRPWDQ